VAELEAVLRGVVAGSPRALGRALSWVENGHEAGRELLRLLPRRQGWLPTVGFTGPPGAGKSTLVEQVGLRLQARGERVAVLAVDPSSPFSGGALLGDRLRMPRLVAAGGFVRSLATRGALGGLAAACADFLEVLRAAPFSWVLVETVGVGQDEVDVASVVDTVVLLQVPGLGDDVQLTKAGVMEIAHVFVVNKKDRPGAMDLVRMLESLLPPPEADLWRPPVLPVAATTGEGVEELVAALEEHQRFLAARGQHRELSRQRAERRLSAILADLLVREIKGQTEAWQLAVAAVAEGREDPLTVAEKLLQCQWGKR